MTVRVRNLQGAAALATQLQAPLNSATEFSTGWAQNVFTKALVTPLAVMGAHIIADLGDGSPGFEIFPVQHSQNNPNTVYSVYVLPLAIYTSCFGVNQFVQATFFSESNVSAGPALLTSTGFGIEANGYYFTRTGFVARMNNNVETDVNGVSYGTFVQGDVMRVSVDIQPTQNVFTILRNGLLLATVTDNSVNRVITGSPGFFAFTATGLVVNCTSRWRTFSAGRGA